MPKITRPAKVERQSPVKSNPTGKLVLPHEIPEDGDETATVIESAHIIEHFDPPEPPYAFEESGFCTGFNLTVQGGLSLEFKGIFKKVFTKNKYERLQAPFKITGPKLDAKTIERMAMDFFDHHKVKVKVKPAVGPGDVVWIKFPKSGNVYEMTDEGDMVALELSEVNTILENSTEALNIQVFANGYLCKPQDGSDHLNFGVSYVMTKFL